MFTAHVWFATGFCHERPGTTTLAKQKISYDNNAAAEQVLKMNAVYTA